MNVRRFVGWALGILAFMLVGCRWLPNPTALFSRGSTATPQPSPMVAPTATPATYPSLANTATSTLLPTHTSTATPCPTSTPTLTTLEAIELADLPVRDPIALAKSLKSIAGPIPKVVYATPPHYALGDRAVFWVGDANNASHFAVTATLHYITPHVYMWVEEGYPINEADLRRSAERFENQTYPTNRALFGSEWTPGVDSDPHIHIFNGRVPGVAGYFYSPNEYSRLVNPFSNEREMFFINLDVRKPGTDEYDATLAHEFQHMIHWHHDRNEDTWVNEGLSVLAEYMNGFSVTDAISAYLRQPDTQLTTWAIEDEPSAPYYGASYLFMAYFLERFGSEAIKALVQSEMNGRAGFDEVLARLGFSERFDDLFADWVIANYLDDHTLEGGRYGYRELELEKPAAENQHREYPIAGSGTVHQYGADYIVLSSESEVDLVVEFAGETTTRLAALTPHSGRWMWWSHRGDDSHCTLSHSFDLSPVSHASLSVWMWYDLEPDWDYAYISVSTDGGKTWKLLEGPHTTRTNPNGNSLGPAYTGKSGGGDIPQWVEEQVDLTAYAGQPIMLRFDVVTDDAVNHPGLFLDDIAIPEIGYFEDAETGAGGWKAAGFVRTDNVLPQRYLVQLILLEDGHPRIIRSKWDERQSGSLELKGLGKEVREAILVISALAPATTETAAYRYTIRPVEPRNLP